MDLEKFKIQCEKTALEFEKKVGQIKFIDNGIFIWEAFAFCAMLDLFDIDVIIESGIAGGFSTEIWGRYFNGKIFALDNALFYGKERFEETKTRLSKYKNIEVIEGDAFLDIEPIILENKNSKIALFVDGPKGEAAITLAKKCFEYKNIQFVGIHDQCKKQNYHEMSAWKLTEFYTDEDWFLEKYKYLAEKIKDENFIQELEKNPSGPGIGFAFNKEAYSSSLVEKGKFLFYYLRAKMKKVKHKLFS